VDVYVGALKRIMAKYHPLLVVMQVDNASTQVANVKLNFYIFFLSFMFTICEWCHYDYFCFFGRPTWAFYYTYTYFWAYFYFPLMENIQSLIKFIERRDIFICDFIVMVKVCQGQFYSLYCDPTFAFKGNEFWSFCGLLHDDHE